MTCAQCYWWRPQSETPTNDQGEPAFGRCVARPPEPRIFAVVDVDEWNSSTMAVVWPQTMATDICGAIIHRDLVDQQTGMMKRPTVMPDDGTVQ